MICGVVLARHAMSTTCVSRPPARNSGETARQPAVNAAWAGLVARVAWTAWVARVAWVAWLGSQAGAEWRSQNNCQHYD